MHILFVGRSVYHYTYYESIIRALYTRGHRITLLFDEEWSKNQSNAALQAARQSMPGVEFGWSARRTAHERRGPVFTRRELRSVASYLRRPEQSSFYLQRWLNYLPAEMRNALERPWYRAVLARPASEVWFRMREALTRPATEVVEQVRKIDPDVVVCSPVNMRYSEEVEFVKAARSLGIPTALPVLSWDNLTTKGLIQVLPDLILAWNSTHVAEAVQVHGAREANVLATGSPFFDKWFSEDLHSQPRVTYCGQVGLSPERPYLLYLGSSGNIARDESWLVRKLLDVLRAHSDQRTREMQVLVRPHPANAACYESLIDEPGVAVWPRDGQLPESSEGQREMRDAVMHSVAAFGINTSGMLDAIIMDRPVLSVLVNEYQKTQQESMHFQHLLRSRALHVLWQPELIGDALAEILDGHDRTKLARRRFVATFVRPFGIELPAGDAAAVAIEVLAERVPPKNLAKVVTGRLTMSNVHSLPANAFGE